MKRGLLFPGFVTLLSVASTASAAITVSSFDTQAQTNAYAPLDRSQYFATDDKPNTSPATANVSADWTGTNIGGSTTTWEMITSAYANTTTNMTPISLSITGAGSFSYTINTTTGFVEPTSVTTL